MAKSRTSGAAAKTAAGARSSTFCWMFRLFMTSKIASNSRFCKCPGPEIAKIAADSVIFPLPRVGPFLLEKDIYGDIVSYLSEKYPRFSRYIARAKEMEASRIKKYALVNKLNPGMAQWVLAVHHKQYAVQKQEITGKDGGPLSPPSITIQPVAVKGKE